jgi:hypothetical protein
MLSPVRIGGTFFMPDVFTFEEYIIIFKRRNIVLKTYFLLFIISN